MRGNIYTTQCCSLCGDKFKYEERRRGLFCPNHPDQMASGKFTVVFGRSTRKRFQHFQLAERFLDGLRYEVDRGTFDSRDYKASKPLSFTNLSNQYLEKKKGKIKDSTYIRMVGTFKKAQKYFLDTNVKTIQYAQLEDFIDSLTVANKTKSNYVSTLKGFYTWLLKRKEITRESYPDFPTIDYELGFRKTIDKETQQLIIEEVQRISHHISPKIWLGIKWLSTYISIRPNEMLRIEEQHIDRKQGFVFIPHPKEKKPKIVPLIQRDLELLDKIPQGLPGVRFFRHGKGVSGVTPGSKFGDKIFYKWWKRACENLDIEGVDLYGGTRHSSAIELRKLYTPEQIKRSTMHTTNKAFERYFQVSRDELQDMYEQAACTTGVQRKKPPTKKVSGLNH